MTVHRSVLVATLVFGYGCGPSFQNGGQAPSPGGANESSSIVGTWEVIRGVRGGEDMPNPFPPGRSVYYTLTADATYRITAGDSTFESGTWSVDTTSSPLGFDHIPTVDGHPGTLVPGIFAIVGDTLSVYILPPTPMRQRPTELRSTPDNGALLLVFTRVSR